LSKVLNTISLEANTVIIRVKRMMNPTLVKVSNRGYSPRATRVVRAPIVPIPEPFKPSFRP
jgi:hypothetical protein